MSTIWGIDAELNSILEEATVAAAQNDGIIPDEYVEAISGLKIDRAEKIEGWAGYIHNERKTAEGKRELAAALLEQAEAIDKRVEAARVTLSFFVSEKTTVGPFTLSYRKSERTILREGFKVPKEFEEIKTKTTVSVPLDSVKKEIRRREQAGEDPIEWAYIEKVSKLVVEVPKPKKKKGE